MVATPTNPSNPVKPTPYRLGVLLIVLVLFLAAALQVYSDRGGEDRVPWMSDYSAALGVAQATNKPILVNFTADWCPPCQDMKRFVYSRPEVASKIDDGFVPLQIDLTNPGGQQESLALRYGVYAIPTLIVLDGQGHAVASIPGGVDRSSLLDWLNRYGYCPATAVGSFQEPEPQYLVKDPAP